MAEVLGLEADKVVRASIPIVGGVFGAVEEELKYFQAREHGIVVSNVFYRHSVARLYVELFNVIHEVSCQRHYLKDIPQTRIELFLTFLWHVTESTLLLDLSSQGLQFA